MDVRKIDDISLVKSVIIQPYIWPYVHDDLTKSIEDYQPYDPIDEIIEYLGIFNGEEFQGMFILTRCNFITFEIHTALLKKCRGKTAVVAAKSVVKWIFENTSCKRLITQIPEKNLLAERLAQSAGMKEYGVNPDSFQLNGEISSLKLYGVSKG